MAESNDLTNAISDAQRVLSESFGPADDVTGNSSVYQNTTRYLTLETLKEAYAKEAAISSVADQFTSLGKEIRRMRSSFLPVDFFQNNFGFLDSSVADTVAERESYENAFMRMLGMPDSARIEFAEAIVIVNPDGSTEEVPYETIEPTVLDERQFARNQRRVIVNGNIYNLDTQELEEVQDDAAVSLLEEAPLNVFDSPKIDNLDDDFYKFSFLLFPPVQDARISRCINETSKLVAAPFSNKRTRNINNQKLKPTLLESIIRIRLDRLSGIESFAATPEEDGGGGISLDVSLGEEESAAANPDSYGVLEALFILRLNSALRGFALKMQRDIDEILEEFERNNIRLSDPEVGVGGAGAEPPPDESAARQESIRSQQEEQDRKRNQKQLNRQRIIEESILSLLGDNSEVLDLQTQTQRNSSVQDAHLMSGLLGVLDIPRKRIEEDLRNISRAQTERTDMLSDTDRATINRTLGVDIGVGNIDILVFALAMFTMSEGGLIGLLSDEAFDNLKAESGFEVVTLPERKQVLESINELTTLARFAYQEFVTELRGSEGT